MIIKHLKLIQTIKSSRETYTQKVELKLSFQHNPWYETTIFHRQRM